MKLTINLTSILIEIIEEYRENQIKFYKSRYEVTCDDSFLEDISKYENCSPDVLATEMILTNSVNNKGY